MIANLREDIDRCPAIGAIIDEPPPRDSLVASYRTEISAFLVPASETLPAALRLG
jgi:hypothetical protein